MLDPIEVTRSDLAVTGGELACFRFGQHADEPVVVAVHGITANSRAWLPVARALGDRATLVAPDIRGRGSSSKVPGPYGIDTHVEDLLAIVNGLGLRHAVLVGHSLGAYIVARFAVVHPDRVDSLVLVDGGLPIPGSDGVDPQQVADGLLGLALARLRLSFAGRDAYRTWWRSHPAFIEADVADTDLAAYADHDLTGTAPNLRSSVAESAVRADAAGLIRVARAAYDLTVPARLLCAPRGLLNEPNPMQPLALARAWAAADPDRRSAELVSNVNHYTITMGTGGAEEVAQAIAVSPRR